MTSQRIANPTGTDYYTEEAALGHHGIDAELGLDYIRYAEGIVSVCLGCASIVCAHDGQSRDAHARSIDWANAHCCGTRIVY